MLLDELLNYPFSTRHPAATAPALAVLQHQVDAALILDYDVDVDALPEPRLIPHLVQRDPAAGGVYPNGGASMWVLRVLSGFLWVAGIFWFIPAAWSLFFRDQMDSLGAWHRMMAGCAFFGIAALVNIYEKLDQIAKGLQRLGSPSMNAQRQPLSDRVKHLAIDPAKKIEAIKVYREETGAGLAEAKEAVEAFINSK